VSVLSKFDARGQRWSVIRQPQDHVAVTLARPAHSLEPIEDARLKPNVPPALGVGLTLDAYEAERESAGNRLVGGGRDGDTHRKRDLARLS
jgi:hypothetical protein